MYIKIKDRSQVVDAVEHTDDGKFRIKFKVSGLWYEKEVSYALGEEAVWRYLTPETGSFSTWAKSQGLFAGLKIGYQD